MKMREIIDTVQEGLGPMLSEGAMPPTVAPDFLVRLAMEIHHAPEDFDEGDIEHRIWKFRKYVLRELPVSNLQSYYYIDDDAVAHYAERIRQGEMPPPIIYDDVGHDIIDGGHRVEAVKLAGLKTIPAYVGTSENLDPDWTAMPDEDE